jgi:hypothetical protein
MFLDQAAVNRPIAVRCIVLMPYEKTGHPAFSRNLELQATAFRRWQLTRHWELMGYEIEDNGDYATAIKKNSMEG